MCFNNFYTEHPFRALGRDSDSGYYNNANQWTLFDIHSKIICDKTNHRQDLIHIFLLIPFRLLIVGSIMKVP